MFTFGFLQQNANSDAKCFFFCKQKLILDAYNKSGNQLHDLTTQITQNPRAANIALKCYLVANNKFGYKNQQTEIKTVSGMTKNQRNLS